jgi:pre-mRNA-processing factor 40
MNGINGHSAPPILWQEARNPEGRIYYYNTITKATQWTKPEDLMTVAEVRFHRYTLFASEVLTVRLKRALANQPWKEYTAEGGRKYWYNEESKQSSWEIPAAYKEALSKESAPATPVAPYVILSILFHIS